MGFVMQSVFLLLFITAGAYMQRNWGITGLVTSELMFAIVAVAYCLIRGVKLKEMFPVKKISASEFFGVVFLAIAGFLFSLIAVGLSMAILPKSFRSEVTGLTDFLYGGMNYPMLVLIVAVLPAICEEAMERGCVLSHFRSIKKDWVIILIMGIFFGIMHMSPLRFLTTATLGALLSYLLVKKNNILLPMLLHFMNNFASVTISYIGGAAANTEQSAEQLMNMSGLTLFGAYLFLGFLAPIFLVLGMMLVDREHHKAYRFAIAGGLSALMMFSGLAITAVSAMSDFLAPQPIVDAQFSIKAEDADAPEGENGEAWDPEELMGFDVHTAKDYNVTLEINGVKEKYVFTLLDSSGKELVHFACIPDDNGRIYYTQKVSLGKDSYKAMLKHMDDAPDEDMQVHLKVA